MARIIIAEDEKSSRQFLSEALALDGHIVTVARHGAEAIALFNKNRFDLLITDLRMPHIGGLELIAHVRERHPQTEVIVTSAHGNIHSAVKAMKLGALDYLTKPIIVSDLRAAVRRAERQLVKASSRKPAERVAPPEHKLTWGAPVMDDVLRAIERVAPTNASVLLFGESGVGKDVFARAIHKMSHRADRPFLAINCAAISETLSESELFGHERGAFTGANSARPGLIEKASSGTLFLDELGALHPQLQAKLLRVIESGTYRRVGSSEIRSADIRWIAATNEDLHEMVAASAFREDLYHRIAIFPLVIPPLRERKEDIGPLAHELLGKILSGLTSRVSSIDDEAIAYLERQPWPGNIRELRNTIERAAILSSGPSICLRDLEMANKLAELPHKHTISTRAGGEELLELTLYELEKRAIAHALHTNGGNKKAAAEHLGIPVRSIYNKIKRFEIE